MRVAAYCRIHDPSLSPSGRDDVLLSRLGPITTLHREPKTDPNWPTELHGMRWMSTPRNTMPETKSEKCGWTKFPAFSYIGGLSPDVVAIGFNQIVIIISLPELVPFVVRNIKYHYGEDCCSWWVGRSVWLSYH